MAPMWLGSPLFSNHRSVLWPWQTLPILLLLKLPMGGEKVNKRKQYVFKGKKKSKVPRVRLMEFDAGFNFNEESCQ